MNIQKELITQLNTRLRIVTSNVHYLHLPDESFLNLFSIVFNLTNSDNQSTFEGRELIKVFQLTVRINSAKITKQSGNNELEKLIGIIDPVKGQVFKVQSNHTKLINEDTFFDPELEVYTHTLIFEMQIQNQ